MQDETFGAALQQAFERITERLEKKTNTLATGMAELDKALNEGLTRGALYSIVSKPGVGKSAFCLSTFHHMINNGAKVAYFTLEMPEKEAADRLYSLDSKIALDHIKRSDFEEDEYEILMDSTSHLYNNHISRHGFFSSQPSLLEDIISKIKSIQIESKGLDCVFIDNLSLVSLGEKELSFKRSEVMGMVIRALKRLATELKVAIVVTYSTTETEDSKAELSLIEQHCDTVFILERQNDSEPTEEEKHSSYFSEDVSNCEVSQNVRLTIAKNRYGKTSSFTLYFFPRTCSFPTDSQPLGFPKSNVYEEETKDQEEK